MSREGSDSLLEWTWTLALAAVGLALRAGFGADRLYHQDSVPLALALEHFDVRLYQPPPPGCFYYVILAGWATGWTGDPARGMAFLSAVFGALGVGVLYQLGREIGGEGVGRASGVLALTAPLLLFCGAVQRVDSVDFFWNTLAALFCYRLIRGGTSRSDLVGAAAALGIVGGVRLLTLLLFAPLALFVGWRARHDARGLAIAAGILVLLTLGWIVPVVALSGDWAGYLSALRAERVAWAGSALRPPSEVLVTATRLQARAVAGVLGPLGLVLVLAALALLAPFGRALGVFGALLARCRSRSWLAPLAPKAPRAPPPGGQERDPELAEGGPTAWQKAAFLLLWGLPPAFFDYTVGLGPPGHAVAYAGALLIAMAMALAYLGDRIPPPGVAVGVLIVVALSNLGVFVDVVRTVRGASPGPGTFLYSEIRSHDRYWQDFPTVVGSSAPPGQILILTPPTPTDGVPVARYHLPEYRQDIRQPTADGVVPPLPQPADLDPRAAISTAAALADRRPKLCVVRTPSDVAFFRRLFGEAMTLTREGEILVGRIPGWGRFHHGDTETRRSSRRKA